MSFNGSGTFVINSSGQPVVANTVISTTVFNALTADLATGLSTCITKDGQTTPTANIPMGTFKFTNLGVGSAATDSATLGQVQASTTKLVTVTGTDTITGTLSPALTAYTAGQMFYFVAGGANTGAVTLNIDGLGARNMTRHGSTALVAGDILSGEVCVVVYDGTRFQLLNPASYTNLNVTGVLALADGAVGTPSLTNTGDENTGLWFPAADTLAASTGGVERLRVDSSGNLGIGTASPASKLDVRGVVRGGDGTIQTVISYTASEGVTGTLSNHAYVLYANNAEAARFDTSGRFGIGTTSNALTNVLTVYRSGSTQAAMAAGNSNTGLNGTLFGVDTAGNAIINQTQVLPLIFSTSNTERARILSTGEFLAGATSAISVAGVSGFHGLSANADNKWAAVVRNTTSSTPFGLAINYSAAAPNNTSSNFVYCYDSGALRASIRANGGLANYQANNVDLSDARTKKDITPAASMWGKVASLEIVAYKYNDQTHDDVNLGVIAQQVESVEPVWVDADGFGDTPEDGVPLKTVYTKDITFAAIKALQEAMARIETLEAKVTALESK